jgi:hypothetical protein
MFVYGNHEQAQPVQLDVLSEEDFEQLRREIDDFARRSRRRRSIWTILAGFVDAPVDDSSIFWP